MPGAAGSAYHSLGRLFGPLSGQNIRVDSLALHLMRNRLPHQPHADRVNTRELPTNPQTFWAIIIGGVGPGELQPQGITMLTTSTLVPIALLMGKDIFKSSVTNTIKLKKKFPVIDDPLVGNYLKLSGLTTVAALTPTTLVPLGIIMLLNNVYKNN